MRIRIRVSKMLSQHPNYFNSDLQNLMVLRKKKTIGFEINYLDYTGSFNIWRKENNEMRVRMDIGGIRGGIRRNKGCVEETNKDTPRKGEKGYVKEGREGIHGGRERRNTWKKKYKGYVEEKIGGICGERERRDTQRNGEEDTCSNGDEGCIEEKI